MEEKRNVSQNSPKKVFVSGCFDILHSGHIAFLKEASKYGDLHVGLGSDRTIYGPMPLDVSKINALGFKEKVDIRNGIEMGYISYFA